MKTARVKLEGYPMNRRVLNNQVISIDDVPFDGRETQVERRSLDVLVVDDEQIIADSLAMILSRSGYSARAAYDGTTALKIATVRKPSLVISDVMMPGITGIELALALEVSVPQCKVLLFSGQATTVDLLESAREMGREFTILSKPVHPTDMLRRVASCLEDLPVEGMVSAQH
jgi:DNA-binding NtrC family response regulator